MPTLDLSNEWQIIDNLEDLVYTSKVTQTTFLVPNTNRSKTKKEIIGERHFKDLALFGEDCAFNVWCNQFPLVGIDPHVGDSFVDAEGFGWIVLDVELCTLQSRWRLTCHRKK